jgi:hypothetical protein
VGQQIDLCHLQEASQCFQFKDGSSVTLLGDERLAHSMWCPAAINTTDRDDRSPNAVLLVAKMRSRRGQDRECARGDILFTQAQADSHIFQIYLFMTNGVDWRLAVVFANRRPERQLLVSPKMYASFTSFITHFARRQNSNFLVLDTWTSRVR